MKSFPETTKIAAVARNDYERVSFLSISWHDEDGQNSGAEEKEKLFEDYNQSSSLHKSYVLPPEANANAFEDEVTLWIKKQFGADSLIHILYTGYTNADLDIVDPSSITRVAENANTSPERPRRPSWVPILMTLIETYVDVLLSFVCDSESVAQTLTRIFSDTLEDGAKRSRVVETWQTFPNSPPLAAELHPDAASFSHLSLRREHYRHGGTQQAVHIEPIYGNVKPRSRPVGHKEQDSGPPPLPPRPVFFPNSGRSVEDDLDEVAWWRLLQRLKDELPPGGKKSMLIHLIGWIGRAREVLFGASDDAQRIYLTFSTQAREDLQDLWHEFVRAVPSEPSMKMLLKHYKPGVKKYDDLFIGFFRRQGWANLVRLWKPLSRNLDIDIMTTPRMSDKEALQGAVDEQVLKDLFNVDLLRLRLLALAEIPASKSLEINKPDVRHIPGGTKDRLPSLIPYRAWPLGKVLTEQKYYERNPTWDVKHIAAKRVESLAAVLAMPKSSDFHTLKCVAWFNNPAMDRYTLAFAFPDGVSGDPVSLCEIIRHFRGLTRPTLVQRFSIALTIGEAIQRWHLAGRVHQAIMSRNINFFRSAGGAKVHYDQPYLCGFEYARPNATLSRTRIVQDLSINVYNHLDRQGVPRQQHRRDHDLYSFGVLLCEIGLWRVAEDLFQGADRKTLSPGQMQLTILNIAEQKLGLYMGAKYQRATVTCLKSSFGVVEDDAVNTRLLKAFDKLVLRNLEDGLRLD